MKINGIYNKTFVVVFLECISVLEKYLVFAQKKNYVVRISLIQNESGVYLQTSRLNQVNVNVVDESMQHCSICRRFKQIHIVSISFLCIGSDL